MQSKLQLNLPSFNYQVQLRNDKPYIFDVIRKKFVRLEPEEWVRQHFIHFMLSQGYSLGLMKIESGHQFNHLLKRTDILAYNRETKPFLLVECKSPDIKIDNKVLQQVANYNRTIRAPYLAVTNGIVHHYFRIYFESNTTEQIAEIPNFSSKA